jgi:hypothetical protein
MKPVEVLVHLEDMRSGITKVPWTWCGVPTTPAECTAFPERASCPKCTRAYGQFREKEKPRADARGRAKKLNRQR